MKSTKNEPHPHAELIKAWADGAKIQLKVRDAEEWIDTDSPVWTKCHEYRIKPESEPSNEAWKPKKGISYLFVDSCGNVDFQLWDGSALDESRYKIGNCFHLQSAAEAAANRVVAALKGELKISAPNDEKIQLDGKQLTDGEKALIRALRRTKLNHVWDLYGSHIVWADYDNHSIESFDNHIAFITDAELVEDDKDIIAALKQIKSEQKSNNE